MTRQYFYSPDLEECAGCGQHIALTRGVGAVVLEAMGSPRLFYTVCEKCRRRITKHDIDFVRRLEQRLLERARQLGAFGQTGEAVSDSTGGPR